MKFKTVGTIKRLDIEGHNFTIDPDRSYKIEAKDGDAASEKLLFKELEQGLRMFSLPLDSVFGFTESQMNQMLQLKLNKAKLELVFEASTKRLYEPIDFGGEESKKIPVDLCLPLLEDCQSSDLAFVQGAVAGITAL